MLLEIIISLVSITIGMLLLAYDKDMEQTKEWVNFKRSMCVFLAIDVCLLLNVIGIISLF